jgi:iron-sulfur cluster assembly protein
MRILPFLALTSCLSALTLILGCNETSNSGSPSSSLPSSAALEKSAAQTGESPLVRVTPKAAATIHQIIAEQRMTEKCYLRIRVVPGGCQGFQHKLDLDPDVSVADLLCESTGVHVVVFKRQMEMLRGAEVDFGELDGKQGFKVENPNFTGESAKKWLALLEKEKDIR